jgi:Rap1a immunity proteins
MSLRERTRPGLGIIEPCLPSPAERPPSGPGWLHEIKHDGFRMLARRDSAGVRLIILLLIFLLAASSAKAQTSNLTGNWLHTVCATSDQQGQVVCKMWISAFQAGLISSQGLAERNKLKPASCIPNDVTTDQATLIIEKFLSDNPQYMQLPAEMVATYALVIAFPCR